MKSTFENRIFLTEAEHETYLRRAPVRFIKKRKDALCCICGKPADHLNKRPLENAHRIPFLLGVRTFKLTPDFLDRPENIKTAHKGQCNKSVELSLEKIAESIPAYSLTLTF